VISAVLLAATVSSAISLSSPVVDVDSSDEPVSTMDFSQGFDENSDRVEDLLEEEIEQKIAEGNGSQLVDVVVLLAFAIQEKAASSV
jgi:hypothetical protein